MNFTAFGIENNDEYLLFDTETTGLNEDDEIIEMGAVSLRGEVLISNRFCPTKEVSPGAMKCNHLSKEILKDEPCFKDKWPELLKIFEGKKIIAHNGDFDKRILGQTLRRYGFEDISEEIFKDSIDTLPIFKSIPDRKKNSLDFIAHEFGILMSDESEKHSAVDDCKLLGNVMYVTRNYIKRNTKIAPSSQPKKVNIVEVPKEIAIYGYILKGLPLSEISEKMQLAVSTLENYVCQAAEIGYLNVSKYVPKEEYVLIKGVINNILKSNESINIEDIRLKEIKEQLPEDISYLKIKVTLAFMKKS